MGSQGRASQRLAATEQFIIDLADFIKDLLHLGAGRQALAGLIDLFLGFEQERLEVALAKRAVEIEKGTVFGAGGVAAAIGFATLEQAFEQRSAHEVGREVERAQEMRFALAQGQRGGAMERAYLTHIYM